MPGREGENVCWAGISLEVPRQSFATFGKSKTVYIFHGLCQNGHHPSSTRCHLQSLVRGKIWGGEKREGKKSMEGKSRNGGEKSERRRKSRNRGEKVKTEGKKSKQRGKIPGGEKSLEGKNGVEKSLEGKNRRGKN